ncbi:biopolymer transporter ExbD [Acaryochloris sp. IP29b_bin.148]|uniref:ExbD/TolR family protein n=1 Tax=Acaryochloris sp. IP29b_bin.148 TaxID=2969218 RepID=UPI002604AFB7|nr:biopolymer transporter ExbD [Acaryochloris sp. IP29b_bin.148]
MKTFLENEDADIQVELIPLLDVVFCLLAVFILGTVGLSRPEGINLNLPIAETGTTQFSSKFRVQVGNLGELLANDQPVNQTQLKQLVSRYLRLNPQGVVILKADGAAPYNQVVAILDLLRSVGGERVALETRPSDPVTPPGSVPGQTPSQPGQNPQSPDLLPVPSVDQPGAGNIPGAPTQPVAPTQPIAPNQPLPNQPLPGQPVPILPGTTPTPQPSPTSP